MRIQTTDAEVIERLRLIREHGSVTAAWRASGIHPVTFKKAISYGKQRGLTADSQIVDPKDAIIENLRNELAAEKAKNSATIKPHFTLRQEIRGSAEKIKLVAVGDLHDSPKIPDKSRFEWIGAYVGETKPDIMNLIGDALTLDSLNTHIPNENYDGKAKPSFIADIASGHEAFDALLSRMNWQCEKHQTDGNHERRLYLFEDRAPETVGMMQRDYDHFLESHGFTHSPYGAIQYYGGVGFVHAALNTLGKTYGGKNSLPTIANDSVSDLVVGHSHRGRVHQAPKIGQRFPTTIIDLGCALPDGHVEDYATHALNGWTYGIYDLTIQFGHVQSAKFISMSELEERYGSQAH